MPSFARWALFALISLPLSCAYPRRTTPLTAVTGSSSSSSRPAHVWSLRVVSGTVPPLSRGALAWDGSDGLPDPFVRIYRDEQLVWESEAIDDTLTPQWDVDLPRNLYAPPESTMRFEVWDRDEVGADPIGLLRYHGLPPNLVTGADARLMLDSGAQLALMLGEPHAHHGLGIRLYEVRDDALIVIEVETHSPAGRAGLAPGDQIVAIGDRTIQQLGSARAAGALAMSVERRERLQVRDTRGELREVELDRGYTWLTL